MYYPISFLARRGLNLLSSFGFFDFLFFFLVDFCRPFPLSIAQNPLRNVSVVCLVIKCEDAFLCGVKSFFKIKCENFMQMRFLFLFLKLLIAVNFAPVLCMMDQSV